MKARSLLPLVALCLLGWVGCSTVDSTIEYRAGTRALQAGDYDSAIAHLERSVQEEPTLVQHQSNLAAAYFAKSRYQDGWPHACTAATLRPRDPMTRGNCLNYFRKMEAVGLVRKGDTEKGVVQNLGQPQRKVTNHGIEFWQYGILALRFQNGRYVGADEIPLT